MSDYFTDREFGARTRTSEVIEARLWGGLFGLIDTRIDDGAFGYRFPAACSDEGRLPYGTDQRTFAKTLEAEVPWVEWPLRYDQVPDTPVVLDILEFCASAVGKPIAGRYHDYHKHTHLSWDREEGLAQFVSDVNTMFARNGVAFELSAAGKASRVLPAHLGQELLRANFVTGDRETDTLLEGARSRFLAPKEQDRRDGLEKLWDAFERIKTLEPGGDKRASADALLDKAARTGSKLRQALGDEAAALTRIGNTHRIRHSEISQEALETTPQVDFLFGRLFAFVHLLLCASGRIG